MAVLPAVLGAMDAVPPHVVYRVQTAIAALPAKGGAVDAAILERLDRAMAEGRAVLGAAPALAEIGGWLVDPQRDVELRRRGCAWLAMYPTAESVRRLAAIATDASAPPALRDDAIRALGDRALGGRHPSTRWAPGAVQLADEALVRLAETRCASAALPEALGAVQWDGAFAAIARAPAALGGAIECYASPALARVLLVALEDLPARHRLRALRVAAATLGAEAVPMAITRRLPLDERIEALLVAIAFVGEPALGALEAAIADRSDAQLIRARATWHLAHRGVVPPVTALRVARATAVLPPDQRARAAGLAADELAALARFTRFAEPVYYERWAELVRVAGDPAHAPALVAAHPASLGGVGELYLVELARRGRVAQVCSAARALGAEDLGAMQLAIWGRPLAALELAGAARRHTPELVYARVLACYRAGRAELAARVLADDPPAPELVDGAAIAFPGPAEQWLAARTPEARPALGALAGGLEVIAASGRPAPLDAEPDATSLAPLAALERRLDGELAGATVYVTGELDYMAKRALVERIAKAGGRLVGGPYPGTAYYVRGDATPPETIAALERRGMRALASPADSAPSKRDEDAG